MADESKVAQGYDGDPPRCMTCVYFRREPHTMWIDRTWTTRKGKVKTVKVRARKHPVSNPIVGRCSFGNFLTKPSAICNEWHNRQGERLECDATSEEKSP